VIGYQGTRRTTRSLESAIAIVTATNATLQPSVKTMSSGVTPYTARISWVRDDLMEGPPEAAVHEHAGSNDPWSAIAFRRSPGGGTPGTPRDRSIDRRMCRGGIVTVTPCSDERNTLRWCSGNTKNRDTLRC